MCGWIGQGKIILSMIAVRLHPMHYARLLFWDWVKPQYYSIKGRI